LRFEKGMELKRVRVFIVKKFEQEEEEDSNGITA
jgi:hypothetical protein